MNTIEINNTSDIVNHINGNAISEDVVNLVEQIREKIRLKRHKGLPKKVDKLKGLATRDLDYLEDIGMLDILGTELCMVRKDNFIT